MQKIPLKMKIVIFLIMMAFMTIYRVFFGSKNMVIGLVIVLAAIMNLSSDMSYKPKLSFIKILGLLFALGFASFLNNPITVWGCALTFLVVFATIYQNQQSIVL